MWITSPIGLSSLLSIVDPLTLKGTTGKIKCAKDPVRYPGPKLQGGDRTSHLIETHADFILTLLEEPGDITLEEIRSALSERGVHVAVSTIWRFFNRRAITRKKRPVMRANRTVRTS